MCVGRCDERVYGRRVGLDCFFYNQSMCGFTALLLITSQYSVGAMSSQWVLLRVCAHTCRCVWSMLSNFIVSTPQYHGCYYHSCDSRHCVIDHCSRFCHQHMFRQVDSCFANGDSLRGLVASAKSDQPTNSPFNAIDAGCRYCYDTIIIYISCSSGPLSH